MSYGLQIFDTDGTTILDTNDRLNRVISIYSGTLAGSISGTTVSISVTGYATDNTLTAILTNSNLAVEDNALLSSGISNDAILIRNSSGVSQNYILYILKV